MTFTDEELIAIQASLVNMLSMLSEDDPSLRMYAMCLKKIQESLKPRSAEEAARRRRSAMEGPRDLPNDPVDW
jgi:hypothetical protein